MNYYLSKITFFIFLFIICFSSISSQSSAKKKIEIKSNRFVLIVCAATNDKNEIIRKGVKKNIESINTVAKRYAHYLDREYKVHTFIDANFTRKALMNAIENEAIIKEGDIVLFYYVGHGKAALSEKEKRPLLIFDGKDRFCPNISAIHSTLKENAKNTVIAIAETCNAEINDDIAITYDKNTNLTVAGEESTTDINVRKAIKDIFKKDKIIYSAQRGDRAYIYNNGGVFMNIFKSYMEKATLDLYVRQYKNENVASYIFKSIKEKVENTEIEDASGNLLKSQTLGYDN